ncbi:MAG: hypothetical protein ACI92Z_000599 [Paracoccaceae bacterium]|jgi:hypothetical protein
MDTRSLFLTANSSTVYLLRCYDLEDGPIVFVAPPGIPGPLDDACFRNVIDIGVTGPDKGEGGKYLIVGPGYEGDLPEERYFIVHTPTYVNWQLSRAFDLGGDIEATVKAVIQKGQPFAPDARMRSILEGAVKVGNAAARSMLETDQRSAGIDSNKSDIVANDDGSYTV